MQLLQIVLVGSIVPIITAVLTLIYNLRQVAASERKDDRQADDAEVARLEKQVGDLGGALETARNATYDMRQDYQDLSAYVDQVSAILFRLAPDIWKQTQAELAAQGISRPQRRRLQQQQAKEVTQ